MSSNFQRPDTSGRAACARLGASASCLVVILAANQAAARDAPTSLPYLAQSSPTALRFAAARPLTPPPPHLTAKTVDPPAADSSAPVAPASPSASEPRANPAAPAAALPAAPPGQNPSAPPANGLPILPDDYAPPAPVTVEDLLPYFAPAPPPVSRATYEVK